MHKKIYLIGLAFVLGTSAIIGIITLRRFEYRKHINSEPVELSVVEDKEVFLNIDNGETEDSYSSDYEEGETAFDLLKQYSKDKEVYLSFEEYDFGVFVKTIGDYETGADKAWIYFINGESATVGADQYELKNGDLIEWKYIEPEF